MNNDFYANLPITQRRYEIWCDCMRMRAARERIDEWARKENQMLCTGTEGRMSKDQAGETLKSACKSLRKAERALSQLQEFVEGCGEEKGEEKSDARGNAKFTDALMGEKTFFVGLDEKVGRTGRIGFWIEKGMSVWFSDKDLPRLKKLVDEAYLAAGVL